LDEGEIEIQSEEGRNEGEIGEEGENPIFTVAVL